MKSFWKWGVVWLFVSAAGLAANYAPSRVSATVYAKTTHATTLSRELPELEGRKEFVLLHAEESASLANIEDPNLLSERAGANTPEHMSISTEEATDLERLQASNGEMLNMTAGDVEAAAEVWTILGIVLLILLLLPLLLL